MQPATPSPVHHTWWFCARLLPTSSHVGNATHSSVAFVAAFERVTQFHPLFKPHIHTRAGKAARIEEREKKQSNRQARVTDTTWSPFNTPPSISYRAHFPIAKRRLLTLFLFHLSELFLFVGVCVCVRMRERGKTLFLLSFVENLHVFQTGHRVTRHHTAAPLPTAPRSDGFE